MRIIKPSAEYLDPAKYSGLLQFIEKVGRTCYKSEDRITDQSASKFVSDLVGSKHWAMLEHGYVYLRISPRFTQMLAGMDDKDKRYLHISGDKMSANLRAMYDTLFSSSIAHNLTWLALVRELQTEYPEVFGTEYLDPRFSCASTQFELLSRHEFVDACREDEDAMALRECLPHTVLFHVNRGVTHELVRHRPASFAQESTRYCNYSKGKFDSEITVVAPFWALDDHDKKAALYHAWKEGCRNAELTYMEMLDLGAVAQEARANLPISVKSDIIVTATEAEWEHILNLRAYGTTGAPHPDMRKAMMMAGPLLREASDGRLYPEDYMPPAKDPAPEGKKYVFILDDDGDKMPLCFGRKVIEFDEMYDAASFLEAAHAEGFLAITASVEDNTFLDTTRDHINLSGVSMKDDAPKKLAYDAVYGWVIKERQPDGSYEIISECTADLS